MVWLVVAAALAQEGPRTVHHSEVDVVTPIPAAFAGLPPTDRRCLVRVQIDGEGVPVEASDTGCDEPYASSAVEAAKQGRWRLREGQVAPIGFVVAVRGRPRVPEWRLRFRSQETPPVPAELLALGDVTCAVHLGISAAGAVDEVTFGACPEAYRARVEPLAGGWQVEPWVVDGAAVAVVSTVTLTPVREGAVLVDPALTRATRLRIPGWPAEARFRYTRGTDVICKTRVYFDADGAPFDVEFLDCPPVFQESARTALMRWRWEPVLLEGAPVKAHTPVMLAFHLP